jgi:hypothetical protein
MPILNLNFVMSSIILPTGVDPQTGETTAKLPAVLGRWDKKVDLPGKIRDKIDELGLSATPSVTMTPSSDPKTISMLLALREKMLDGERFSVPVDVEESDIDVVGKKAFYIRIRPEKVHMSKMTKAEPIWDSASCEITEEGKTLSEHYKAVSKILTEQRAKATTPSGAPLSPGDEDEPGVVPPF